MTEEQKRKVFDYYFPNEELRKFLCNDFYQELSNLLPTDICIGKQNLDDKLRTKMLTKVILLVKDFILINPIYQEALSELFKSKKEDLFIFLDDIVKGYVFYISITKDEFKEIDVFKDKRSICWSPISIADIL